MTVEHNGLNDRKRFLCMRDESTEDDIFENPSKFTATRIIRLLRQIIKRQT